MRVGSLFSGIGGLDLGLERAGMEIVWQVEIDPFCNKVLEKHWPAVKRYGNIKEIEWEQVERVDLVCGGFPCPPVSVAGRRKGDADDRWLWPEFERCLRSLRPTWVVIENVRGLLSSNLGREFAGILRDLSTLGYDVGWWIVSAADVGASHKRERVFIVAHSGCLSLGGLQPVGQSKCPEEASVGGEGKGLAHPESAGGCGSDKPRSGRFLGGRGGELAHPESIPQREPSNETVRPRNPDTGGEGNILADTDNGGCKREGLHIRQRESRQAATLIGGPSLGNPDNKGLEGREQPIGEMPDKIPPWPPSPTEFDKWATILRNSPELAPALPIEPRIRGMAHGLSPRVDRLRALGNAVVPQVAEIIGRVIMEASNV